MHNMRMDEHSSSVYNSEVFSFLFFSLPQGNKVLCFL
jgi:hypothetical protein